MSEHPEIAAFGDVDGSSEARRLLDWLDATGGMEFFRVVKPRTYELASAAPGVRVLDVGCGAGDDVRALARLVGSSGLAVGVDRSEEMVAEAARRGGAFVACHASALAFADSVFDAVRAERVLVHVGDPSSAVGELFRVARPGGRVVCLEADMETLVVDAPDRAVTRRVLNAFCDGLRSGWAGRRLYGLFVEQGAADVSVTPVSLVLTSFEEANRFWTLEQTCRRAVPEAADAWIASLEEADREGRFFCSATGFIVAGRKAAPDHADGVDRSNLELSHQIR